MLAERNRQRKEVGRQELSVCYLSARFWELVGRSLTFWVIIDVKKAR